MALDARPSSLDLREAPSVLGNEDANAQMSEFPSIEAQELVTKVFLRAELAELHEEIAGLESTLTVRIGGAIAASAGVLLAGFALLG